MTNKNEIRAIFSLTLIGWFIIVYLYLFMNNEQLLTNFAVGYFIFYLTSLLYVQNKNHIAKRNGNRKKIVMTKNSKMLFNIVLGIAIAIMIYTLYVSFFNKEQYNNILLCLSVPTMCFASLTTFLINNIYEK